MDAVTRGAADARDARIVVEWMTGRHLSFRRAVFCSRGASTAPAGASLGDDDVLFAPVGSPVETAAHVIRYEGDFTEIGDILHVAGHALELQHYAAAAYVELLGPTAMRFLDTDGWRAFVADADLARSAGVFPSPMSDARLRLADAEVFRAPFLETAPVSVHVDADDRVTLGAQGSAIGTLDDVDRALSEPQPRWAAFAGVVEPGDLVRDLTSRPWLARYVDAAGLSSVSGFAPTDRIDGFGWSALSDPCPAAIARFDDPFLVRTSEELLLISPRTRRRQRLSETTAVVVATLHASVDVSDAADRLARALDVTAEKARALCGEAEERLGVHCGVSVEVSEAVAGGEA